jgi:ribosome maturation factor RimP
MNFLPLPVVICYGKPIVHRFYSFCIILVFWALLAGVARGQTTVHLTDGQTLGGELVSIEENGFIMKKTDGSYSERIPWSKLSQADLKELDQNPKAAPFVEPLIEVTQEEKIKHTEVAIKEVPRLSRPKAHSLFGALAASSLGFFTLLVLYAANLYAAYEVSIFRARPPALVCGISAIAPVLGPIIFLSLPSEIKKKEQEWKPPAETSENYVEAPTAALVEEKAVLAMEATSAASAAASLPPTKTFSRGQFMFNRRFFETQMPGLFGLVRTGDQKDLVLEVKSARGLHAGQRIVRINANDLTLQVAKGHASEEVVIPFSEIQEVQLKHKDA